ncbi:MAG: hypothetical protein AB7T49_16235 [Oligoflexales bacterium]
MADHDHEWKRAVLRTSFDPYFGPIERVGKIEIEEVPEAARQRFQDLKTYYDPGHMGPEDVGHYEGGWLTSSKPVADSHTRFRVDLPGMTKIGGTDLDGGSGFLCLILTMPGSPRIFV